MTMWANDWMVVNSPEIDRRPAVWHWHHGLPVQQHEMRGWLVGKWERRRLCGKDLPRDSFFEKTSALYEPLLCGRSLLIPERMAREGTVWHGQRNVSSECQRMSSHIMSDRFSQSCEYQLGQLISADLNLLILESSFEGTISCYCAHSTSRKT